MTPLPINRQSAIRHFSTAMFMSHWKRGMMGVFTVYFDESGSPSDTAALAVAGFIATAEEWIRFEREWTAILETFDVPALHMRNFAHSTKEFKTWKGNEGKRRAFLSRLIRIIRKRTSRSFACTILMEDYKKVDLDYHLSDVFKPYAIAARNCVDKVNQWAKHEGISEVAYIFEDGACDKGELIRRLRTDGISKYGFLKKSESVAFQAADLLAYEQFLANVRVSSGEVQSFEDLRQSLRELNKAPNDWGVYAAHNLTRLCADFIIPKRPVTR
jgi:hypothetical protein